MTPPLPLPRERLGLQMLEEKAAFELARVLVDEGRFFIVSASPNAYSVWKSFYLAAKITGKKLEGTMQIGDFRSRDVLFLHSFEEIKESLQNAGLRVDQTETFLQSKESGMDVLISVEGRKVFAPED